MLLSACHRFFLLMLGRIQILLVFAVVAYCRVEYAKVYGNIHEYAYYFVDVLVGKPVPQRQSVILDTGSSMLAFPCDGCDKCGRHMDPLFKPSNSKTFEWQSCTNGNKCKSGACNSDKVCTYHQSYTEGSSISGKWFSDYIALGDSSCANPPVQVEMGCHTIETKLFATQKAAGIMGVAFGATGHPTVIEALFAMGNDSKSKLNSKIFSICLSSDGGMMAVGGQNNNFHHETTLAAYTPITGNHYYSIKFDGMFRKPQNILMNNSLLTQKLDGTWRAAGVIVDSGTTFTYLSSGLWSSFLKAVQKPQGNEFSNLVSSLRADYCYKLPLGMKEDGVLEEDIKTHLNNVFPSFLFELSTTNHIVEWLPSSYFFKHLSQGKPSGLYCIAVADNGSGDVVLGASFMIGLDTLFDRQNNRIGFVKSSCPKVLTSEHRLQMEPGYTFDQEENDEGDMCLASFKIKQNQLNTTNDGASEADEIATSNSNDKKNTINVDLKKYDLEKSEGNNAYPADNNDEENHEVSSETSKNTPSTNEDSTTIVTNTFESLNALSSNRKLSIIFVFLGGAVAVAISMGYIIISAYKNSTSNEDGGNYDDHEHSQLQRRNDLSTPSAPPPSGFDLLPASGALKKVKPTRLPNVDLDDPYGDRQKDVELGINLARDGDWRSAGVAAYQDNDIGAVEGNRASIAYASVETDGDGQTRNWFGK